jgi:hypothetical protein
LKQSKQRKYLKKNNENIFKTICISAPVIVVKALRDLKKKFFVGFFGH